MSLTSLFLDMNAFFASCEQHLRPELRGRPVIVVPVQADTTCCIAASYEAKRYGIKTGTSVREARQLCKHVRLIEARPEQYIRIHQQITAAVDTCVPITAVCSIDEMYCRLLRNESSPDAALAIGRRIKRTIADSIGPELRCSVGIAPNWYLAKVAAEMNKPDGLTLLERHELPDRLYCLDLSDLPGIGRQMFKRLSDAGITTVRQLCALSKDMMHRHWNSVVGTELWRLLQGEIIQPPSTRRRTVGHSHVLPPEFRTDEGARAVLVRLIHKAAMRLRHINYWAQRMDVFIQYQGRREWSAHRSLGHCQDTSSMLEAFADMWRERPASGTEDSRGGKSNAVSEAVSGGPLSVGMRLSNLVPAASVSLPLFPDERLRLQLSRAIDAIQFRHGHDAVYFGGMFEATHAAPMRIAFTNIPNLDLPR